MGVKHCQKCGARWDDVDSTHDCPDTPKKSEKKDKTESEDEEEDLREDLKGQADQIHDLLETSEPLTYEEIGHHLDPQVSADRASRLVSQMIRDGVELKREGSPRKVSIS